MRLFVNSHYQRDRTAIGQFFARPYDVVFDLIARFLVDKCLKQLMFFDDLRRVLVDLENVAVLDQDNVLVGVPGDVTFDELFLAEQPSILAVDRHDKFWPRGLNHCLNVL